MGRKIIRDNGKAIGELISEIDRTISELSETDINQAVIKSALGDAAGKLAQAHGVVCCRTTGMIPMHRVPLRSIFSC